MFTGLIEGTGKVAQLHRKKNGVTLLIRPPFPLRGLHRGESIAINGCCLTVAGKARGFFQADLSPETLKVTNLGKLATGTLVNLERPVRLADRLGGHLVQGHVDGVGQVRQLRKNGNGIELEISFPRGLRRYLIPKGSITVDGVSLTAHRLKPDRFTLVIIPETLRKTNLGQRQRGDCVNLEVDIVGKYMENFAVFRRKSR